MATFRFIIKFDFVRIRSFIHANSKEEAYMLLNKAYGKSINVKIYECK